MKIRRAESTDVVAVTALVARAYARYVSRIGRSPAPVDAEYEALVEAGDVWVADAGGRLGGVVVFRAAEGVLELENVAVDPPLQGRGLGRALIAFAEAHASELGLAAVELYTNEAMTENLELYARLGYVETERRVEDGFRRVFFRKPLDDPAERR